MASIEELRKEAHALIKKDENNWTTRSCWKCNGAHTYMKKWDDIVISCFVCGQVYFKGKNITEEEDGRRSKKK